MTSVKINYNPHKGDVVSRLMVSLSEGTGWPISKEPDLKADINYFALYIQVGQSPNVVKQLKKTAAWFTHYEVQRKDKMNWWNIAASKVDIRTTTASQYYDMLKKRGETHLVYPPPIDNQFRLPVRKPRIGISGFVHPSGRKGEHLVKRLYDEMGDKWDIVATGQGWPVPDCRLREWQELPAFYQSLDIFLVTSLTEGIPMPPFEALACGVPIVIPHYVGIFNQLGDDTYPDGMWGYELDNYDEMLDTLQYVVSHVTPDTQSAVKNFTQEAWCKSHKEAFGMGDISIITNHADKPLIVTESESKALDESVDRIVVSDEIKSVVNTHTPIENKLDINRANLINLASKKSGAICVAYGKPSLNCASNLIPSWNKYMSDFPIALVSDTNKIAKPSEFVFISHPDTDIGGRSVKTNLYNIAPQEWQYVLYLDADTEIIADVSQIFKWLDSGFDMIFTTNPQAHATIKDGIRPDNRAEYEETIELLGSADLFQLQGGVIAFARNERVEKFWNSWYQEWDKYGGRDQFALLRALHNNPVKYLLLGNEWNTILRDGVDLTIEDSAGIIHLPMRARRWQGIIYGDLRSDLAWKAVRDWDGKHAK